MNRLYYKLEDLDKLGNSSKQTSSPMPVTCDEEDANLIGSLTRRGLHAPVIDIDLPMEWVPSSTPGHGHLYINKELPWETYLELLLHMSRIGLVEYGYVSAAMQHKQTFVRKKGVYKPGVTPPRDEVEVLREENTRLREEIRDLKNSTTQQQFGLTWS